MRAVPMKMFLKYNYAFMRARRLFSDSHILLGNKPIGFRDPCPQNEKKLNNKIRQPNINVHQGNQQLSAQASESFAAAN